MHGHDRFWFRPVDAYFFAPELGQLADHLPRLDRIMLNELGYLPFSPSSGALPFVCSMAGSRSVPLFTELVGTALSARRLPAPRIVDIYPVGASAQTE